MINLPTAVLGLICGITGASPAMKTPEIPNEKYVLESNGLEVILSPDHSLPVVAVNLWYHVGPAQEAENRTGFAHLFEHLMFQGSKHVGDDGHFKRLEAAGASEINGTTGNDRTNYFETVPANQLELALWLESDRMGFLLESLTHDKFENQRQVVMNERKERIDNVPYGQSRERLIQSVFEPTHPYYGNIIGSMADIEAATLEDARSFFKSYYTPANATLVISGDFDEEKTRKLVDKYFGTLPKGEKPARRTVQTAPIMKEKRVVIHENVPAVQVQMAWLTPAFFAEGDAELDCFSYLLGGGTTSRLYKSLVEEKKVAQFVYAHQQSNELASVFTVVARAHPGVTSEELLAAIDAELNAMKKEQVKEKDLQRVRNLILTGVFSDLQKVGERANTLNQYNHYIGTPDFLGKDLERYQEVTPASIKAMEEKYLDLNHRVVVVTELAKSEGKHE
jgi:zinc protease